MAEDYKQCTEMVFIAGQWYQCNCFKGEGHDTSEFDHIVDSASVLSLRKGDETNTFKRASVTITWT